MDWVRPAGGGLFLNICFSSFGSVMCCRAGGGHCRFPIVFLQTPRQASTPPPLNGWPHAPMMVEAIDGVAAPLGSCDTSGSLDLLVLSPLPRLPLFAARPALPISCDVTPTPSDWRPLPPDPGRRGLILGLPGVAGVAKGRLPPGPRPAPRRCSRAWWSAS